MKVKKMENFQNKRGLMGCKWSSLNAPGTETPLSHSVLELGEFPFPIIRPKSRSRLAPVFELEEWLRTDNFIG